MSKLGLQNFVNHKISNDDNREWSFCTEFKTPKLPFKLTDKLWHIGWDIPTHYAIDADNECWMDMAHGPSLRKTTFEALLINAEDIKDKNKIRQALGLPIEKSIEEQLAQCKVLLKRIQNGEKLTNEEIKEVL